MLIKPVEAKTDWEKFLSASPQASFLQSYNWGEFHQALGHKIFRLGFYEHNELQGLALLIKIAAKRGRYLECPGGPVIPWGQRRFFSVFTREAKTIAQSQNLSFIRIRPNVAATAKRLDWLRSFGWRRAPMHLHAESTWLLDLDLSEDELLKNMRKTTRYLIKKAQKLGVKVTLDTDEKTLDQLYRLQLETVGRHNFVPFSHQYLAAQLAAFRPDNQIQLFKAEYEGQVLAVAFIIFYGQEAVYHYSGSSSQFRQIPASYLLQWEAIKIAKARGFKRYNFWGFTADPKHRFFGPSLFKKGFGGYRFDYLPAHDLAIKPCYWLTYLFEQLRRRYRRL